MAGIALQSCKLQIRCKAGTLASGGDSVKSISFSGANQMAEAATVLAFKDAVASVISTPVIEVLRVDSNLVSEEL